MLEQLTYNLSLGKIRRTTVNGREYIVAPATIINPGVLNGSKGALYYPDDEVARNVGDWNGISLTHGHPLDASGNHVSGNDPTVPSMGRVYNDRFQDGKRRVDTWFDVEAVRKMDPRILNRLEKGEPIELSTGLYTDNEETRGVCPRTGRSYDAIARNYRPDHLAILPDQKGACSNDDGCGVLVNGEQPTANTTANAGKFGNPQHTATGAFLPHGSGTGHGEVHDAVVQGHKGEPMAATKCPDCGGPLNSDGKCMTCGKAENSSSMPKTTQNADMPMAATPGDSHEAHQEKVRQAVHGQFTQGQPSPSIAETHDDHVIYDHNGSTFKHDFEKDAQGNVKLAKKPTPVSRKVSYEPVGNKGNDMDRKAKVTFLVTNCDCWKTKGKLLENAELFSDADLTRLVEGTKQAKVTANLQKQYGNNFDLESGQFRPGAIAKLVANAKATDMAGSDVEEMADVDPSEEDQMKGAGGEKGFLKGKAQTANQWFAQAPPEVRTAVQNAVRIEKRERQAVINQLQAIVANESDPRRKAMIENKLKQRLPLDQLEELLTLVRPTANTEFGFAPDGDPLPVYMGGGWSGQGGGLTENEQNDVLDLDTARQSYDPILTNRRQQQTA